MNDIQRQFDEVIKYSQDLTHVCSDDLFKKWEENKRVISEVYLNGQLTKEVPNVTFTLADDDKRKIYNNFLNRVVEHFGEDSAASFLHAVGMESFFNNLTPSNDGLFGAIYDFIHQPQKISKTLKNFIDNEKNLDKIQQEYSMILQEVKVTGTLVLSIHPLDYLSVSENTYNWRSCHALDGDYRAGNLNYMIDQSTVVCYLKGLNETKLPRFPESVPWNSKKWRMLLFFSRNYGTIFAGRQYPFFNREALDIVASNFLKQPGWFENWTPEWRYKVELEGLSCPHYLLHGYCLPREMIIKDGEKCFHYNDLLYSSCYIPYAAELNPLNGVINGSELNVGAPFKCLDCGKELTCMGDSFLCAQCELDHGHSENESIVYCAKCGRRIMREDARWHWDDPYCEYCYQEQEEED